MALNRKNPPKSHPVGELNIIQAQKHKLDNDIPLYVINAGSQDVIKIDFVFPAGIWYQDASLVASTTNAMLTEGTRKYGSNQIAEKVDYYGAFLESTIDKDNAVFTLYTLKKYIIETIPIVEDVLKNSIFPEHEFSIQINRRKQAYILGSSKVEVLASRMFGQVLFGDNHPYGRVANLEDFDKLKTNQLKSFFSDKYNAANCKIIISGKVSKQEINLINKFFGNPNWNASNRTIRKQTYKIESSNDKEHLIAKKDSVQSAIRIGKVLFNRTHPDYMGMQVLNKVLGGYFGSRLMSNIREDKGYTYGINSMLVSSINAGYFAIVSEVGTDVCSKAITEVRKELSKLRNELIPKEELLLVKNYMLGEQLKMFDDSFSLSDSFRILLDYNLDYDYFHAYRDAITKITPEELNKLSNKYLHEDSMIEVIAGEKNK